MTFGFSKWALSALLGIVAAQVAAAQAAPGVPAQTPEPEKPKVGYVRFWNLLAADAGSFDLQKDTGRGEPEVLLGAAPMNIYADYEPTKPGRYGLKVVRSADPKTVLKTFDLILKADVFVTFVVRMSDGQLTIEMIDDTFDREKTTTGRIVVRQFFNDASVIVKSAGAAPDTVLRYGEERAVESLPLRTIVFQMEARLANGLVKNWASQVNFKNTPRASLFLVPDTHGRFRPRVAIDGQIGTGE